MTIPCKKVKIPMLSTGIFINTKNDSLRYIVKIKRRTDRAIRSSLRDQDQLR